MATQTSAPFDVETERDKYFECVGGRLLERDLGSGTHSDIQYKVLSLLKSLAAQRNARVRQEWSIARGAEWMTPDVMLSFPDLFTEDARGYLAGPAFLCVEILSPSQSAADLFRKCLRYYAWGVPHCWVIDPKSQACFEYHGGNDFILAEAPNSLTAGDLTLAISDLFADQPI